MHLTEEFDYWVVFENDGEVVYLVGYETLPSNLELTELYDELYEEFTQEKVDAWDSDIVLSEDLPAIIKSVMSDVEYEGQESHTINKVTVH